MTVTAERRSRRTETLPAKLGLPETAKAGRGLAQQLKSLATPSRQGDKGFLDGAEDPSPVGPVRSSYREMLRASGQEALLRVQHGEPQGAQRCGAAQRLPGKLPAHGADFSPSLPLPSLLLSSHLTATGDSSVRSTTSAPCLPSGAFSMPAPSNRSLAPSPVHLATSPAGSWYWPEQSPTFGMERRPSERQPSDLLAFAMQQPPAQSPQAAPAQPAEQNTGSGGAYLMAIAMPQARHMSWDPEQIAAQLRAVAPEVYED